MDFAKDVLCHEYVGEYIAKVKLTDTQRNVISCHDLGLCVFQVWYKKTPAYIQFKNCQADAYGKICGPDYSVVKSLYWIDI